MARQARGVIDPMVDLDWATNVTWVQDYGRLRLIEDGVAEAETAVGVVACEGPGGERVVLDPTQLLANYLPSGPERALKPRYDPAKGCCVPGECDVDFGSGTARLQAGDAILRRGDGFTAVPRAVYLRDYRLVEVRGVSERPPYPFPDPNVFP